MGSHVQETGDIKITSIYSSRADKKLGNHLISSMKLAYRKFYRNPEEEAIDIALEVGRNGGRGQGNMKMLLQR